MRRPANEKQQHQSTELIPQTPDQPNISTRRLTLFSHVYKTKRFAQQENVYWFSGVDRCSICAYAQHQHPTRDKNVWWVCAALALSFHLTFFVEAHRLRSALLSRASVVLLRDSLKHTHTAFGWKNMLSHRPITTAYRSQAHICCRDKGIS